jgi:hypothetical protein
MGRKMAGPEAMKDPASKAKVPTRRVPPGHFLSSELESDTARFLAELKDRLRRRRLAEQRPALR